ncbi:MAG: type III glutamate--ammonia ligase [Chloroflexi bacterium]|nr:type III glutamate--ammonia ligase [Chloroflexota bacterium]
MNVQEVSRVLREKNVDFVFAQYVDLSGVPRAKLVPANHIGDLEGPDGGAFFAGFAAFGFGQEPDDPDLGAVPDFDTLTILPWQRNTARFACDVYFEGKPWHYCTRTILKRVAAKAREMGYVFNVGVEPEFYLVAERNGRIEPWDAEDRFSRPCYDLRGLTRSLDFLQTLIGYMNELGWEVYATDHEDANAQFEINFGYSDCVTTADRYTFFRYMASMLAHQRGAIATFMPKPWGNRTGNGAHFHMSLADAQTGKNAFLDPNDPQGLGLSHLAYHFIGGLLLHARGVSAFTAPTVNSYKRLISTGSMSGATWAPVYITYGGNNRTQMLRVPAPGRVENRTIDSACNPYLAAAAILAAGLDGIERGIDPGPKNDRNLYALSMSDVRQLGIKVLPGTLREAVEALHEDGVIRHAIGTEYADYYADIKLQEWSEYHNSVSDWEVQRYLRLF